MKFKIGTGLAVLATSSVFLLTGCASPAGAVVGVGVQVVGSVVESENTRTLGAELVGQPPAQADAKLGMRVNTLRDVNGGREWLVYPNPQSVLNSQKYVVEVANGRIASVALAQEDSNPTDLPAEFLYFQKVQGATPQGCEAQLGLGAPLLTLRSANTGGLVQIYDAHNIADFNTPHYCVVRFDPSGRCMKLDFVEIAAKAR